MDDFFSKRENLGILIEAAKGGAFDHRRGDGARVLRAAPGA